MAIDRLVAPRRGKIATALWIVLAIIVCIAGLAAGFVVVRVEQAYSEARAYAAKEQWFLARRSLQRYLWLHPHDSRSLLLMAETYVKDDDFAAENGARQALDYLHRIGDDEPLAADARTQEGRVHLFLEHKVGRAEEAFRRAIELDAGAIEPRYLLYKLMDITGRSNHAEATFWDLYRLTPDDEKAVRLREWYMSQFFPLTANPGLDRAMGFLGENEEPTMDTERIRFTEFRNAEPDRALGHAVIARWCDAAGDPKTSLELLNAANKMLDDKQKSDPFLLATKISTLINLGMFDDAEKCLRQWPEPRDSYEYFKWKAVILDEVHQEYAQAIEAYDRTLALWPGPADWRTRFRKATCFASMGKHADAERERTRAHEIEELMDDKRQQIVRHALGRLDDPQALTVVAEFYRDLGRPREAASWLQQARRAELLSQLPSQGNGN